MASSYRNLSRRPEVYPQKAARQFGQRPRGGPRTGDGEEPAGIVGQVATAIGLGRVKSKLRAMASDPELTFDLILARLREAVERLESGDLSLEQSLAVYEEGVALARRGQSVLDHAEKRVELLVSASGTVDTVPFNDDPT
jgi:exodeoxyribonuclease VII small subunit